MDNAKNLLTTTFVLYEGTGPDRTPVCSDEDWDVIRAHKVDHVRDAFARGKARPVYSITRRETSHPLVNGSPQANGSTCEEHEVE